MGGSSFSWTVQASFGLSKQEKKRKGIMDVSTGWHSGAACQMESPTAPVHKACWFGKTNSADKSWLPVSLRSLPTHRCRTDLMLTWSKLHMCLFSETVFFSQFLFFIFFLPTSVARAPLEPTEFDESTDQSCKQQSSHQLCLWDEETERRAFFIDNVTLMHSRMCVTALHH